MPPSSSRSAAAAAPSSSTPPSPHLPQELVDLIIDQLAHDGDLATLQACALTAASWLPRCRSHLFGAVYLHPGNYTHMKLRFRPSPNAPPLPSANSNHHIQGLGADARSGDSSYSLPLAQYVRHVLLQTGTRDEDEQPVPRDGELPASLLMLFPNAEEFELVNVRWAGLRPDVRRYFTAASAQAHMVQALTLREVVFPTLGELVGLVQGMRGLKIVRLRNVTWEGGGGVLDNRSRGVGGATGGGRPSRSSANPSEASSDAHPVGGGIGGVGTGPHLEELEMYECTSPGAFISHLFAAHGFTDGSSATADRLRRLALDWTGREEDPAILRNLILEAGAALQILEVDLAWQQPNVPLDLRLNTGLRELYLDGVLLDESEDSPTLQDTNNPQGNATPPRCWMPTVTTGISSWVMRKFVCYLILSYLPSLQLLDLERIDEVLSRPQFDSLECVVFSITILPISGVVPPRREEIWEAIRRRMVGVEARGVLKQMRDGVIMG